MTCKQARQLLAAYRQDDLSPGEHAELHAHLLECVECQAQIAEFRRIGERLQALPKLAPPPDFYARVMAAVQADERQTERAQTAARKKPETVIIPGMTDMFYLPALRRAVMERRARVVPLRRQLTPTGAFALRYGATLAALFLVLAFGLSAGLLVLLQNPGATTIIVSHTQPLYTSAYSPDTAYPLVTDATVSADGQYIIYAAHNAAGNWMLEELNTQTEKSTALLPSPVAGPITLEGWARSWVLWVWGNQGVGNHWQLDATELSPALPGVAQTRRLLQGNAASPDGKVAALHGISSVGSTVLLAEELANGRGQLVSLDLAGQGEATRSVLYATQLSGHLIADPAAVMSDPTTGEMTVYWTDQWQDPDGTLHGNIWRLAPSSLAIPVTTNDGSFFPTIVAGKLIWLEEQFLPASSLSSGQSASSPTPSTTSTPDSGNTDTNRVAGLIWSENLDGRPDLDSGPRKPLTGSGTPVSNLRAGATFVVWQVSKGSYSLYDAVKDDPPRSLNEEITNPLMLSVAPTAVLWMTGDSVNSNQAGLGITTINVLQWPQS